jgi:hypothetical protein
MSEEIDTEEFDAKRKEIDGLHKWLELRQNDAMYSEKSPCEVIEELLKEAELTGENGELPWEVGVFSESEVGFRGPAFDEPI